MKLEFISILVIVIAANSSSLPWETTLVCTINSTCCPPTCKSFNESMKTNCSINNENDTSTDVTVQPQLCNCSDGSCTFTISITNSTKTCDIIVPDISLTLNNVFDAATTNQSIKYLDVQNVTEQLISGLITCRIGGGLLCWVIVGLGSMITLLLVIILTLCVFITCLLAKGKQYQYSPNVVLTQSGGNQNQVQEQQPSPPQNQDSEGQQQSNVYHILDPQYETVDNKREPRSESRPEPVHYSEPEPSRPVQAKVMEEKGLTGSGSQSSKLKVSLEKVEEQESAAGVFYDELSGPGYPKGLKQSEHSATSLPKATPKYSSLQIEDGSEQKQTKELIPLYSMPDKNKKKQKDKSRETELTTSQLVKSPVESKPPLKLEPIVSGQGREVGMSKPKSPSPPPPELPPKPGQASKVAEETKLEEEEESAYAEVSSRPITSASARSRTQAALGATISPLHLTAHSPSSPEREKGNFRRSYSMEGYFGSEPSRHQKASNVDFRRLYDAPMTLGLHTRGMAPPQEQLEEEESRHGFFRAS